MRRLAGPVLALALAAALGACATGPDRNPEDPLEPMNRKIFAFNDKFDRYLAKPVAQQYDRFTPRPLKTMITNFFANIGDIPNTISVFLQGRVSDGFQMVMRLATNTVFGIGGVFDVATPAGLTRRNTDFGLTLGTWGFRSGPYLVLPLFGPSSIRDGIGFGVDMRINPISYMDVSLRNSLYGLDFADTRARYLGATQLLEEAALDKYTFVRDAYLQQRKSSLSQGKEEAPPNYETETTPPQSGTPVPVK
jgi:phospholipid-binding lipoprotein MlaA